MDAVQIEVFPFAAKANAVRAMLPRQVAHELAGARVHCLGNCYVMSHAKERRVENQNVGTSDSDAGRRHVAVTRGH